MGELKYTPLLLNKQVMTQEQMEQREKMIQRVGKYQIFLENDNNLKLFRKIYDMKRFDLIIYLQRCGISIQHNIKLTRDEKVFLNEMERCYQRVLKNEVKSHEYLDDVPQYKPTI